MTDPAAAGLRKGLDHQPVGRMFLVMAAGTEQMLSILPRPATQIDLALPTASTCWPAWAYPRWPPPASMKPHCLEESPHALALRLALAKARAVAALRPEAIVIGFDQVADLGGQPLGKPGNHERATAQLRRMSGQTVISRPPWPVCQAMVSSIWRRCGCAFAPWTTSRSNAICAPSCPTTVPEAPRARGWASAC